MDRNEFLQRFTLSTRPTVDWLTHPLKPSAVLVALQEQDNGLHFVLTRRPGHMRQHAHQICFAGGRQESSDIDLMATALREAEEELGICATQIDLIGELPTQPVLSRSLIHPYVGFLPAELTFQPDPSEVSEILRIPLTTLLDHERYYTQRVKRLLYHELVFIPYEGQLIWGATAAIIRRLADQLYPDRQRLVQQLPDL
ncbi:MAG: CoA pyrophosphatase [Gammaproteobacteria bacterium]|nr:CoA pyrophosphatase [Gammaproteobacteria bacterium]